jgi:GNAT superfamily N-acetyltransferase
MSTPVLRRAAAWWRRLRSRVPSWLFAADRLVVFELPLLAVPSVTGIGVRELSPVDLPRLAACRAMTDPNAGVALLARRFQVGARAFGVEEAGRLVGYVWSSLGAYVAEDDDGYRMDLGPRDAYLFDAFLRPDARGRGLFELLLAAAEHGVANSGALHFLSTVSADNAVSLQVHARVGACRIESVGYACVAGLRLHTSTSAAGTRVQLGRREFVSRAARGPEDL